MQLPSTPPTLAIVNKWGNVDLSKVKLNKRYQHVRGKRLQPLCRKLGIRYAPAVVGWWDSHRLPHRDGVVVSTVSAPKLRQAMLERDNRLEILHIKRCENDPRLIFIYELGGELRNRGFEVGRRTPPVRVLIGIYKCWIDTDFDAGSIVIRGHAVVPKNFWPRSHKPRTQTRARLQQWGDDHPPIHHSVHLYDPESWDQAIAIIEQIRDDHVGDRT